MEQNTTVVASVKARYHHLPVMVPEVLEYLDVQSGGRYIDATCGEGGHAEAILKASGFSGQILGIDANLENLNTAKQRFAELGSQFIPVNDNFKNLYRITSTNGYVPVHGILFDLGLSSAQLDVEHRGFSFRYSDPLDMRFSSKQSVTAADIVNGYTVSQLMTVLRQYGEETHARRIAERIVQHRPLRTSRELADLIAAAVPPRRQNVHPATRSFQALRIAVNDELTNLKTALEQAVMSLGYGGRLVVISYHSLEDRIVKHFFRSRASDCECAITLPECACNKTADLKLVTRGVAKPTAVEVKVNRRSRSAKLRAAMRI